MKTLALAALVAIATTSETFAHGTHLVQGLSCKTEAQMNAAVAMIQRDVPPLLATEMLNREGVVCVFADRIWYIVDHPLMIGQNQHRGRLMINYQATLVGVLVGQNPRPIEPPLTLYFVSPDRLPGAPEAGGA